MSEQNTGNNALKNTCTIINNIQCRLAKLNNRVQEIKTKPLFNVQTDDGTTVSALLPVLRGDLLRFITDGGVTIEGTEGSAIININPDNMLSESGPPVLPPTDTSRMSMYVDFSTNITYYWKVDTQLWSLIDTDGLTGATGDKGDKGTTGATGSTGLGLICDENNNLVGGSTASLNGSQNTIYGCGAGLENTTGSDNVFIGFNAGNDTTNSNAIAIGSNAGEFQQGTGAVAIGFSAGITVQGEDAIAIGNSAGSLTQGASAVAIGAFSGFNPQGQAAVAIGYQAGQASQGDDSIAIGHDAGAGTQGASGIAIGFSAGQINQGAASVAIGTSPGQDNQGTNSVAIGSCAGANTQSANAVAIGNAAGLTNQGGNAVAIGTSAGAGTQSADAIAIGNLAGQTSQGISAVAIGDEAGAGTQSGNAIAIGNLAGRLNQGGNAIAVGIEAGERDQNTNAIAIGNDSGGNTQGDSAVAIGVRAGRGIQGDNAIAIGINAGLTDQGNDAIAIGNAAGQTIQGTNSVAIGALAAPSSQDDNSIVLNASGIAVNTGGTGRFYVDPIRAVASPASTNTLVYNSATSEIIEDTAKSFVIDHPIDNNKYLVHACLEGPEAGVYYRGESNIEIDHNQTEIILPDYVEKLASEFTINITPIYNGKTRFLNPGKINNGRFTVYGESGPFYWTVYGKRQNINVEPDKLEVELRGLGPYKWLE